MEARCERESLSRSFARKRIAGSPTEAGRLQTHARRRSETAAGTCNRVGESAGWLNARTEHHAPMGRQLLVLPPLPRREKSERVRKQRRGKLLDGRAINYQLSTLN